MTATRVSFLSPVFTGRVHGLFSRPVNTSSVYRPLRSSESITFADDGWCYNLEGGGARRKLM